MSDSPSRHSGTRNAWLVLIGLLALETLAGLLALVPLGTAFFAASGQETGQRVSVLLAGLLAVAWIAVTFVGALPRTTELGEGSAITLHVLMFAAGTGALQYALAPVPIAWALILAALVGFFSALLARPEAEAAADEADAPSA